MVKKFWQWFYRFPTTSPFTGEILHNYYCLLAWCYPLSHPCRTTMVRLWWAVSRKLFMQRRVPSKLSSLTEGSKSVDSHITLCITTVFCAVFIHTLRLAGSSELSLSPVVPSEDWSDNLSFPSGFVKVREVRSLENPHMLHEHGAWSTLWLGPEGLSSLHNMCKVWRQ